MAPEPPLPRARLQAVLRPRSVRRWRGLKLLEGIGAVFAGWAPQWAAVRFLDFACAQVLRGRCTVAMMPLGLLVVRLRLAALPYEVTRRALMLESPVPEPLLTVMPWPESATRSSSAPAVSLALTWTKPPCGSGDTPCLIAFSTSVRRIIVGTFCARRFSGKTTSYSRREGIRRRWMAR